MKCEAGQTERELAGAVRDWAAGLAPPQRDCADRVVRTMIAAHFIDRQELDELEPDPRRPINELPQRLQIADAEIVLAPQGKQRCQNARDLGDLLDVPAVHGIGKQRYPDAPATP